MWSYWLYTPGFSFLFGFKKRKTGISFSFTFFFFNLLLAVLGLCCCEDLCLVVERRCYCPVLVYGLVTEVASFVVDPGLQSTSLTFVVHGLSCSTDCGTFLDQGSNTCLPHWQADSWPLSHQESSCFVLFCSVSMELEHYFKNWAFVVEDILRVPGTWVRKSICRLGL